MSSLSDNLFCFILVSFLLCVTSVKAQYHTKVTLRFMERSEIDTSKVFNAMPFPCYVQQRIIVSECTDDSLELMLPNCAVCWLNTALYSNINIYHTDSSIRSNDYSFDGQTLVVPVSAHDTITITYYYNSEDIAYNESLFFSRCLFFCQETWHSVWFTCDGMLLDTICVHFPYNAGRLTNATSFDPNDTLFVCDRSALPKDGFALLVFDTMYYYKLKLSDTPLVQLYLFRGIERSLSDGNGMILPRSVDVEVLNKIPSNTLSVILKISDFFDFRIDTLEILDGVFSIAGSLWGSAFPVSHRRSMVLFDESFWNSYDWVHEIIHCYHTCLPDRGDSSFFFFHESMTEFLAVYFASCDSADVNRIFKSKQKMYRRTKDPFSSVFQITSNSLTSKGGGSFGAVYVKTPYCLYRLAEKVGKEEFFRLLNLFFTTVREKGEYSFVDFENFMLSNGVPADVWKNFKRSLYMKSMRKIDKLFNN